jgi:hypothetical protein
MDVLLEGEVDPAALPPDAAVLGHLEDPLPLHPLDEVLLDLRMSEVEEVARVVPDEPVLNDGAAVASDLVVRVDEEHPRIVEPIGEGEAADAGADDEEAGVVHRGQG